MSLHFRKEDEKVKKLWKEINNEEEEEELNKTYDPTQNEEE